MMRLLGRRDIVKCKARDDQTIVIDTIKRSQRVNLLLLCGRRPTTLFRLLIDLICVGLARRAYLGQEFNTPKSGTLCIARGRLLHRAWVSAQGICGRFQEFWGQSIVGTAKDSFCVHDSTVDRDAVSIARELPYQRVPRVVLHLCSDLLMCT